MPIPSLRALSSFSLPFLSLLPLLSPPPLPPRNGPVKPAMGLETGVGSAVSSPIGIGAEPWPQSHFSALYTHKTHLIAAFLVERV